MIGMINIPNDSPAEFYAASPRRFFSDIGPSPSTEIDIDSLSLNGQNNNSAAKPSFMSVFSRKKNPQQIRYLSDGRKVFDGQVVNPASVPKLWEQLIVRTLVHKMEDEISSPADQFMAIQEALPKLSRQNSTSTYSLVSQSRVETQCDKCTPQKKFLGTCSFLSKSSTKLHNCGTSASASPSLSHSHSSSSSSSEESTAQGSRYLSPSKKIIRRRSRNSNN